MAGLEVKMDGVRKLVISGLSRVSLEVGQTGKFKLNHAGNIFPNKKVFLNSRSNRQRFLV